MLPNKRRLVLGGVLSVLFCAGVVAALPRVADELPKPLANVARLPERLWTRFFPPLVSRKRRLTGLTKAEREIVRVLGDRLDALIVWSSNRSGNHELYLLDLQAQSMRRLTNHPNVDFFSRFSPDGRRIAFLRSQREWVSFRERTAWDVYLINVDGSGEQLIATGGYHPSWTHDGMAIVFQRQKDVFRYDLATRRETLIFDGQKEIPGLTELGDVELAPDNRGVAFFPRGSLSVFDLIRHASTPLTHVQACQPTWAPDSEALIWIEVGGNGGTRVMTARSNGSDRRVLIDLPGAYSHEYFPKLSNDGRWLVWGAAAEGHEHDRADYEIFVWEVGMAAEAAVRVTFNQANDQWPDLWVRSHN